MTSSFLISSSRGQSRAKGSPSRFCRCSQDVRTQNSAVLLAYMHLMLHHIFSYCFTPACEELTLKLKGSFNGFFSVTRLPDESPMVEVGADSKPDTSIVWQDVKQEHFECDPLPILGKL